MRIYDISQEVFSSRVYPGDPAPQKEQVLHIKKGDPCNLTVFSMCAHNGTHVDAPYHFFDDGAKVHQLSLEALVGECYVAEREGVLGEKEAEEILALANARCPACAKRILLKGKTVVGASAAKIFAQRHVLLVGNESQTVGDENAPAQVHRILLEKGVVLLEGIRLSQVEEGAYFLFAAPLCLKDADGAPCRAVLTSLERERL